MIATNVITRIALVFLIGGFLNSALYGATDWPGPRRPTLIERWEAELIVYVEVVETERKNGGQVSRLKILSIIKSDDRNVADEIKVLIATGSHWPYTFTRKQKAVAFLKFDKKRELYVGYNATSGGVDVDETTGMFYVRQYAKLPAILKEKDPRKRIDLKLEWNVEFALCPKTRFEAAHGIHILWYNSKKLKLLSVDEGFAAADFLTASQKKRICKPFADEVPNAESYHLISMLRVHPSSRIDGYLLRSLHLSLKSEDAVPLGDSTIGELAVELLPDRIGFKLSRTLESGYDVYQDHEEDFTYDIDIGDEHTDAEKRDARTSLVKEWRNLTSEFLKIPELQKIQTH